MLWLLWLVVPTRQEMSQELEQYGNSSEERQSANDIVQIDFSHTGRPLAVCLAILIIGALRIGFSKVKAFPHSVLLLIVGIGLGIVLSYVIHGKEFYLHPDFFFVILLPPIVLDAGYFMRNKDFFRNLGTISVYAVIGTLANTAAISVTIYYLRGFTSVPDLPFLHCVIFGTLICAVDPVAVLTVFEDIHVNEMLHILVFGESLLNDAVTIVLYHTVTNMCIAGPSDLPVILEYAMVVVRFNIVSFGGIAVGLFGGLITAFIMKICANAQHVQPILLIAMPFVLYLLADTFHLSGILAIATVGLVVKKFIRGNVCDEMKFVVDYAYKMASSYAEATIFVFLGVSVVSNNHVWDYPFIAITVIGCLVYRFVFVFLLTFMMNQFRRVENKISFEDQLIMGYGGLRGAVSFGLVMSIDDELVPHKNLFVSTTLVVILFTTIAQGTTIAYLVKWLKVKRSKTFGHQDEKKKCLEKIVHEANKHVIVFMEALTKEHDDNAFYRWVVHFDRQYLQSWFTASPASKAQEIAMEHMNDLISDYASNVKRSVNGASFAGMPTEASLHDLHLPTSKSELFAAGFDPNLLSRPMLPMPAYSVAQPTAAPTSPIPHNVSVTGLVNQAFDLSTEQHQRSIQKSKRVSGYSRHLMPNVPESPMGMDRPDVDVTFDDTHATYMLTFPYSKGQDNKYAQHIRTFGRSLKDKDRLRVTSPVRAMSTRQGTSHPRETNAPPKKPPVFAIVDESEDSPSPPLRAGRGRVERTVNTGVKTFTVGEDTSLPLLPIKEDKDKETD